MQTFSAVVYGLYEEINENRWDLSYKLLDLFNKELQIPHEDITELTPL